ncbi:MAG: prepilin-type N-terminal cleavage/methylation domain-containing protein [Mollicutes bacterium]|nr:prepilin-type N-terminal cleavage/methylation domain-containing protein [Mollicutes bacterium]
MNNKGLTLVELLAVIVILGVVATIGGVGITAVKRNIDVKATADKVSLALGGVSKWGQDNMEIVKSGLTIKTIGELIDEGYIETDLADGEIYNEVNGNSLRDLEVALYFVNRRVYTCVYEDNSLLGEEVIKVLRANESICPQFLI